MPVQKTESIGHRRGLLVLRFVKMKRTHPNPRLIRIPRNNCAVTRAKSSEVFETSELCRAQLFLGMRITLQLNCLERQSKPKT